MECKKYKTVSIYLDWINLMVIKKSFITTAITVCVNIKCIFEYQNDLPES